MGALACESVTSNSARRRRRRKCARNLRWQARLRWRLFLETQKASRGGSLFVCVRFWSLTCSLYFGWVANLCAPLGWLIRLSSELLTYALIFCSAAYGVALDLVLCGFVSGFLPVCLPLGANLRFVLRSGR